MTQDYWNPQRETMRLQDLKELQVKQLKHIIKYVYTSNQFYHKKLSDAHVEPEAIQTLDDI
jgi:phenylacetate-coenzyme A ligase PaaK-like adenylate-forming protein